MQVVIELLRALQKKGKNDVIYVQFDSIQKLGSAYASVIHSSPSFACQCSVMKGEKGRVLDITNMPTDSTLFKQIMVGCEK